MTDPSTTAPEIEPDTDDTVDVDLADDASAGDRGDTHDGGADEGPVDATSDDPVASDPADSTATDSGGTGAGDGGEEEVLCPGCGLTLVGDSPRRPSAEWFCPRCDYPLFWAAEPDPDQRPASRAARRRLPGTGGRTRLGAEACWHCGEMSEPGDTECRRCAATLPKPMAPTVEVEVPIEIPVPVLARPTTWPFVVAALLAGSSIGITITLWITGTIG